MKKILSLCTALLLFGSMTIQAAEDVYRVAGSSSLFGSNWSATDDNNKMTLQNGKYRLVKENTSSSAISVEFKVVKNGSWNSAYPSSNYSISVPGNTKLLITYTTSGNAVNAQILGGYVGAHGTMTSSSWATVQFTAASNKETASHTYNLKAGTYQFGMRVGASNNWTSNGSSFTRTNNSRTITSENGNCSLNANVDGDYTFTWTYETNTLTITYPPQAGEYDITATTATHWTYGSLPTSKTSGQNVQFTVTPDAGYSVEVSSSDVTITKNGNTYSFTMPNNDVAINVAATALSYNITYPASPAHYTLASGNPTSGNTDAAINITVTPDAHYVLTVTANGTELTGENNVYSFTMPAEAVTIAVTAQAFRSFNGSTPLYLNAAHVDWWCNDNAVQHATFVKEDDSEVVVTGVVEEGKIYAFTPAEGYYKSVKFSRHDPGNVSTDWGHTDNISLIGTDANNYVSTYAQNSTTATWSNYTPVSHTYTVAGNSESLFGTAWAEALAANDMVDQGDGTYLFERTGIELSSASGVEFKVCQDHAWTNSWPASNYALDIPSDGIYTITITFTRSTKAVTAVATKTGEAVVIPTIAISSNITSNWEDSELFVSTDGDITAHMTLTGVAAGNYELGVKIDGAWTANGAAFTRANNANVVAADPNNSGNLTFNVDQAGDYTFTWTYATNTLEITYPALVKKAVYVKDLTGWAEVALYAYDTNNTPVIGNWPGMVSSTTEEIDDETYIKYEIPESYFPCTIIFNNNDNGQQTANYSLATAQDYYLVAESGILHDISEVLETYHLYVRDLTGWNTFKTYAWGDKEYFGTWDDGGAANSTTTIDGATYNVYDFQAVAGYPINMNIIFHNGTDQLDDYQVTEAKDYYFTVTNDAAWEGLVGLKRFRTCEPIEHLYGYQFDENGTVGAEWPGAELTANGEGWYEFIVNKGRTLIFNTGTGEGAMQTGDLAYTEADPVADECAVWQGETNVADNKTYMVTSDNPDAPCILIYERNVTAGNYGTICLPYEALSVSGATLYSISGSNDNGIFIDQESSLLKGVPYIFLASEDKITVRYWDGQSFTPSVDNLYTTNGLVGFIGENESAEYTVTPDAHNFILYQNGLYYVDSPAKIRSNRAYIDWSNLPGEPSAPAPGRQRRVIGVHQTPTAIDQIYEPASMKNGKYMINGQLFIINNGMIYNAQGQIVK